MCSHGQLLLRSNKSKNEKTNIDIIFFDTNYIKLNSSIYGIEISNIDNQKGTEYESINLFLSYPNAHLFEIKNQKGEKYFVGASFVRIFENELNFNETSLGVLDYKGRDDEIASSV